MPVKTTVITGPTSGIGKVTAFALAKKNHALYLLVRNVIKGERFKDELIAQTGNQNIYVIKCDLTDFQSIREAADELKARLFNINILINNAGGFFARREVSKDGFEMTFALNHLGPFLLTMYLMPLLEKGQARIINVSSEAHKMGKPEFDDLQHELAYSPFKVYGMTKLFNIYFTKSLAEKYADKGITAYALHPGMIKTAIWDTLTGFRKFLVGLMSPFMITAEQGAETTIYLATQPRLEAKSGLYFKKQKVTEPSGLANDVAARNKLWLISEKLTKVNQN